MQTSINSFNQSTLAVWNRERSPVVFSAHLQSLNSNRGTTILTAGNYQSFLVELKGLKALGITGVVLNIDYPILNANFDPWGGQSANFLTLYQNAIAEIRALGLKVTIETGAIFSDPAFSSVDVSAYYASLSTAQYMNGRAQQALLIAQQLQPDYLNVVAEPDTEALQTGKSELYTFTGSMQLLNTILGVLRPAGVTSKIGAGVGTWLPTDSQGKGVFDYVSGYASTSVDSIDMHVYPVIRDYLARMNTIADLAQAAGKRVTITEAWAYKERDSEAGILPTDILYARDVYSFWYPIDNQFLTAMVNFSFYQKVDMMAVFWSGYLRSYLTYDNTTATMTPSQLNAAAEALQGEQMKMGAYSPSGMLWESLIVSPADTTPPDAPVVTATGVYPNQVVLSWNQPADNVGVSRFVVSRSGMTPVTTVQTVFTEAGLSDGKKYVYVVTAYDAQNNKTSSEPLSVDTPDITAPTPPTTVTATLSGSNAIVIAWSGATDNVRVTGYKMYRGVNGATPSPFAGLGGATTSYTNSNLQSNATYCYYLLSQDATLRVSTPSETVCATTPDTQHPTVPTGVTAAGTAPPQITVTWLPSTDGVGVAGYNIQRSVNGGVLSPLVNGVKSTSYLDNSAAQLPDTAAPVPSIVGPTAASIVSGIITFQGGVYDVGVPATYIYRVSAFDAAGNVSPLSAGGRLTWPGNPSGVAGVRFLVDNMDVAAEDTVAPYYIRWDTRTVANGQHTLLVIARDNAGNTATSTPVVITVQN